MILVSFDLGICPEEGLNFNRYVFVFVYFAVLAFVHLCRYWCGVLW